jgi:energy-converting hydrogenase Eha subunit A
VSGAATRPNNKGGEMQTLLIAVLVLSGFAAGVVFSSVVRVFVDRQISRLQSRATAFEASMALEAEALRARVVDLEQKVKRCF